MTDQTKKYLSLAVIVAALIVILIYADKARNENLAKNGETLNQDEDWKTYRNEEYGFEFKYKGSIYSSAGSEGIISNFSVTEDNHVFKPGEYELALEIQNESCRGAVHKAQTVALANGTKYIGSVSPDSYVGNGYPFAMCAESGNNFIYMRIVEEDEQGSLANQILSSFKFIESDSKALKTYKNDEYGFEIKYPNDFNLKTINLDDYAFLEQNENGLAVIDMPDPKVRYPNTDLRRAYVLISTTNQSQSACGPENNYPIPKTSTFENINGTTFSKLEFGDAAAGTQYFGVKYSTYQNGTCFIITNQIITSGYGAVDGLERVNRDEIKEKLYEIFSTFKFIK